jgi:hypothetical protein
MLLIMLLGSLLLPSPVQTPAAPPASSQAPAVTAAPVALPDTPAGRALGEFVASFNAGGEKRRAFLEGRTTLDKEQAAGILGQDAEILGQHGAVQVVRIPTQSAAGLTAILRHEKSGAHGHLTLEIETTEPHRVSNMQLRGATPEEVKGK